MKPRPHYNTALLTTIALALRQRAQGLLNDEQAYHAICNAYLTHGVQS